MSTRQPDCVKEGENLYQAPGLEPAFLALKSKLLQCFPSTPSQPISSSPAPPNTSHGLPHLVPAIANRPDAVYQAIADKVTSFIAAKGCGADATNPVTGNVLPHLWVRGKERRRDVPRDLLLENGMFA
ncbi:hypothetical protein BDK51DRAFT_26524 [Blyttiomyces helicus]|uniref:Uncharacterized protein n=1 Tax=Blyttiomyces helicus TaxID=388810 RepID=A0A4P9W3F4_9FUNG|nr:hypothetical protein BDK51DRAFT_26524 [Blyttiomyces helicus]|eukprot:RKO86849.1 hypothetical protein BDK51DRAFT_26524 [Blyttiomyces helicus]